MIPCPVCKSNCATLADLQKCVDSHVKAEEEGKKEALKLQQNTRLKEVENAFAEATKKYEDANKMLNVYLKDYPNANLLRHIELPLGRMTYSNTLPFEDLLSNIASALRVGHKAGY